MLTPCYHEVYAIYEKEDAPTELTEEPSEITVGGMTIQDTSTPVNPCARACAREDVEESKKVIGWYRDNNDPEAEFKPMVLGHATLIEADKLPKFLRLEEDNGYGF